jgi:hypothetical protein
VNARGCRCTVVAPGGPRARADRGRPRGGAVEVRSDSKHRRDTRGDILCRRSAPDPGRAQRRLHRPLPWLPVSDHCSARLAVPALGDRQGDRTDHERGQTRVGQLFGRAHRFRRPTRRSRSALRPSQRRRRGEGTAGTSGLQSTRPAPTVGQTAVRVHGTPSAQPGPTGRSTTNAGRGDRLSPRTTRSARGGARAGDGVQDRRRPCVRATRCGC